MSNAHSVQGIGLPICCQVSYSVANSTGHFWVTCVSTVREHTFRTVLPQWQPLCVACDFISLTESAAIIPLCTRTPSIIEGSFTITI